MSADDYVQFNFGDGDAPVISVSSLILAAFDMMTKTNAGTAEATAMRSEVMALPGFADHADEILYALKDKGSGWVYASIRSCANRVIVRRDIDAREDALAREALELVERQKLASVPNFGRF